MKSMIRGLWRAVAWKDGLCGGQWAVGEWESWLDSLLVAMNVFGTTSFGVRSTILAS